MRLLAKIALLVSLAVVWRCPAAADSPVPALLASRCQICHNDQTRAGGLSLKTMEGMRKGSKRGPAVVPGHPEQSVLYQLISGGKPAMPLVGGPLTKEQIESVRQWIEQGAPWSSTNETEAKQWWSLLPLNRPPVPNEKSSWVRTPIDAFILAKLREKGLEHSQEADSRTLIRRLTYDLHGLPPSPEAVDAFVADDSPDAYEKLVDRLLASPRYGERWGRHWLDAAWKL